MALFTIGDTHLALGGDKPMDVFDGWQDYVPRLEANWRRVVGPEDTVVIAGDISWGMKLEDCREDFAFLHGLPGRKLLMKGNHDYWWTTASKMQQFFDVNGFTSLHLLFNNAYKVDGVAVCGTRGWMREDGQPHDVKIAAREAGRLRASLEAARAQFPGCERLAFLHYPPVYTDAASEDMVALLQEYGVKRCFYGHLHGGSIRWAVQGEVDGIHYKLISADALGFMPYRIL